MPLFKYYRLLICSAISLIFIFYAGNWIKIPFLTRVENITYDLRLKQTAPNTLDNKVIILDIDEKSLKQEGRWPWSRDKMSYLVDMLFEYYDIKLLAFDIVFAEQDQSSGLKILEKLAANQLAEDALFHHTLETIRPQLAFDDLFAQSLRNRDIVLSFFFDHKNQNPGRLPNPIALSQTLPFSDLLLQANSYGANLDKFQLAAQSGGFINNPLVDIDGSYRKLPMLIQYKNQIYPSFSLAILQKLLNTNEINFITGNNYGDEQSAIRLDAIKVDLFNIPVDEKSAIYVPYRGKKGSFRYISATDVLNGIVDVSVLKDNIIIMGATAAGILDLRVTPVQNIFPGVEIHANIVSGLLNQSIKSRPGFLVAGEIIELIFISLVGLFLFSRLAATWSSLLFFILLVSIIVVNFYLWQHQQWNSILATPIILLCLLYAVQMSLGYFFEGKRKKRLGKLFGQYIPPQLVDQLDQSGENITLNGESREMSVLFSDVRDFTSISEKLNSQELCQLINEILTPVTKIIHDHSGTIDKYIGDAVMSFWGAPLRNSRHAYYSVQAALAIIPELEKLQQHFTNKGWPRIKMGIGINSGKMSVGNMGSEFRMAYTIMGDSVNLGSRLEGLTKQYGVNIIVSENTKQAAPEFFYRELDKVRVKGREEPITIYEPMGIEADISSEIIESSQLLSNALELFRKQQWDQAYGLFSQLDNQFPDTLLYQVYIDRIQFYLESPPGLNWDGVFAHSLK